MDTLIQGALGFVVFGLLVYGMRAYFEKHGKKGPPPKQYTEEELAELKRVYEEIEKLSAELGAQSYVLMWRSQGVDDMTILGYLYQIKESRGG